MEDPRSEANDPFLPSGKPFAANLLRPLQDDPALKGTEPRLSALRFSRIPPSTRPRRSETIPLKVASRRAVRAVSGISARVRYHRSRASSRNSAVTASLDVEIPSFTLHAVSLESINLQFLDGRVEMIAGDHVLKLPLNCRPHDNIVFLYHLIPNLGSLDQYQSTSPSRSLEVSIDATVLVSSTCRPRIEMRWKATIDFSTTLNPDFGRPGQSIQRDNRPTSLPALRVAPTDSLSTYKNSSDSQSNRQSRTPVLPIGITVTFTTIDDIYVGEPFRWDIFVVNRSSKARTLALVAIPKRNAATQIPTRPVSSVPKTEVPNQADKVADAVLDENVLYTMQRGLGKEGVGLVCLSPEVRIGYVLFANCNLSCSSLSKD